MSLPEIGEMTFKIKNMIKLKVGLNIDGFQNPFCACCEDEKILIDIEMISVPRIGDYLYLSASQNEELSSKFNSLYEEFIRAEECYVVNNVSYDIENNEIFIGLGGFDDI